MNMYFQLFLTFFRIGLFTFGGGYSMLPMLQREVVERRHWVTEEDLLDYFAIGQCTPGIIAVNTATLVGHRQRGALGAAFATLGIITPSLIIITIIASVLQQFAHIAAVQHAFAGIRVAVAALIVSAVIKLFRANVLSRPAPEKRSFVKLLAACWPQLLLCIAAFLIAGPLGISPVYVVVGAVLVGLLFFRKEST